MGIVTLRLTLDTVNQSPFPIKFHLSLCAFLAYSADKEMVGVCESLNRRTFYSNSFFDISAC